MAQYLTIYEAAARLGVSDATVRRRIRSGALLARRSKGGRPGRWEVLLDASQGPLAQLEGQTLEEDLAAVVGRQHHRLAAQTIELARVRALADRRAEEIMALQQRLSEAESATVIADYVRSGAVGRRVEELTLAACGGFLLASLVASVLFFAL